MRFLFLICMLFSAQAYAALSEVDLHELGLRRQIFKNGGAESGKVGWSTPTGGTVAIVTSGPGLITGNVSLSWDSNGAGQIFGSLPIPIPNDAIGRAGVAGCNIRAASGTATHLIQVFDGTTVIGQTTILSSTTNAPGTAVYFNYPSSGNITLRLMSVAANEPQIFIDNCGLTTTLAPFSVFQNVATANNNGDKVCRVEFGGPADNTNCTTGTCTQRHESGNCISAVNRVGAGLYQAVFSTNYYSAPPVCTCSNHANGIQETNCGISSIGTGDVNIRSINPAGALSDSQVQLICIGPR